MQRGVALPAAELAVCLQSSGSLWIASSRIYSGVCFWSLGNSVLNSENQKDLKLARVVQLFGGGGDLMIAISYLLVFEEVGDSLQL